MSRPGEPPSSVAAIIPFGGDCPYRQAALEQVRDYYRLYFPSIPVFVGDDPEPGNGFSRGRALNAIVAELPSRIRTLIRQDGDSLVPTLQLRKALVTGHEDTIVRAYTFYRRLREPQLGAYARLAVIRPEEIEWEQDNAVSHGCMVLSRALYEEIGGYDPRFIRYYEDCAFDLVAAACGARFERVPGPLYHLWHPADPQPASDDDLYYKRYEPARGDREALLAIRREVA